MGGKNFGAKKIRARRSYHPWLKTNKMVAKFYNHSGAGGLKIASTYKVLAMTEKGEIACNDSVN